MTDEDHAKRADRVGWAALAVYDRARDDPTAMLADVVRRMGEAAIAAMIPPDDGSKDEPDVLRSCGR